MAYRPHPYSVHNEHGSNAGLIVAPSSSLLLLLLLLQQQQQQQQQQPRNSNKEDVPWYDQIVGMMVML